MELENQSAINPHHKSRPIMPDQPSIGWIKFIIPSSYFRPSLECPILESAQIFWINPLSVSLIFLDFALVIGPTETCNGSFNTCWFSSHLHKQLKTKPCNPKSLNQTNIVFFFINHTLSALQSLSLLAHQAIHVISIFSSRWKEKLDRKKNSSEIHAGILGYVDTSEREDEIYEEDREKGENV